MSLRDLILFKISAPRHTWKWLLSALRQQGISNDVLDEWTKQLAVGVPYHDVGAEMLAIRQLREEFCFCRALKLPDYVDWKGDQSKKCVACALLDRIVEDVR